MQGDSILVIGKNSGSLYTGFIKEDHSLSSYFCVKTKEETFNAHFAFFKFVERRAVLFEKSIF